jgi:hypothetical protein
MNKPENIKVLEACAVLDGYELLKCYGGYARVKNLCGGGSSEKIVATDDIALIPCNNHIKEYLESDLWKELK